MSAFILVDLASQLDEVTKAINSRDSEQILTWLRQFGQIHKVSHPLDKNLYGFESKTGIRTGFRLTDSGEIIVIGQHTTQARGDKAQEYTDT